MNKTVYKLPNVILLVKDGVPNKTKSGSQNYYDISFSINTQTGYINKVKINEWKLYISGGAVLPKVRDEVKDNKYYFYANSFEECKDELERITNKVTIIIKRRDLEKVQIYAKSSTLDKTIKFDYISDFCKAVENISEFYFSTVDAVLDGKDFNIQEDKNIYYEQRFVTRLIVEFEKIILAKEIKNYENVNLDLETMKNFIYGSSKNENDKWLRETYKSISPKDKFHDRINTKPDFMIHKSQSSIKKSDQLLVAEVKTSKNLNEKKFWFDYFKLQIYVQKFNFQNAIFLITNNPKDKILEMLRNYEYNKYYQPKKSKNRVLVLIKENVDTDLEFLS